MTRPHSTCPLRIEYNDTRETKHTLKMMDKKKNFRTLRQWNGMHDTARACIISFNILDEIHWFYPICKWIMCIKVNRTVLRVRFRVCVCGWGEGFLVHCEWRRLSVSQMSHYQIVIKKNCKQTKPKKKYGKINWGLASWLSRNAKMLFIIETHGY